MNAFAIEGKTLPSKTIRILNLVSLFFEGQPSWNRSTPCHITTGKQSLILYYLKGACVLRIMKTIRKIFLLFITAQVAW